MVIGLGFAKIQLKIKKVSTSELFQANTFLYKRFPPPKFNFSGQQVIFYISCHVHLFTNSDTGRIIITEKSPLHSVFSSVTGTDFICILYVSGENTLFLFLCSFYLIPLTVNNHSIIKLMKQGQQNLKISKITSA